MVPRAQTVPNISSAFIHEDSKKLELCSASETTELLSLLSVGEAAGLSLLLQLPLRLVDRGRAGPSVRTSALRANILGPLSAVLTNGRAVRPLCLSRVDLLSSMEKRLDCLLDFVLFEHTETSQREI